MADINKTVQVDVRASLKDIMAKFKTLPGLTEKEARKLAKGFTRQLRQTERAAKKAAASNKKSMHQMGKSFEVATTKAKSLRTQSREVAGSLTAMEDVIREVNPELGTLASQLQTGGMAVRAFSRSLATGNKFLIAAALAVAGVVAIYTVFTKASREAAEQQKRLADETKKADAIISQQARTIEKLKGDFVNAERELAVFTGQMSKFDANIAKAREANKRALDDDTKKQNEIILNNEELIQLARKATDVNKKLTEQEEERLKNAIALTEDKLLTNALDSHRAAIGTKMFILEQHLTKENNKQRALRQGIIDGRNKELSFQIELMNLEEELRRETEEEERREEQRQKSRQRAQERTRKLNEILNSLTKEKESLEESVFRLQTNQKDRSAEIINDYKQLTKQLDDQRKQLNNQLGVSNELQRIENQRSDLFFERDAKLANALTEQLQIVNLKHERELAALETQRENISLQYEEAAATARTSKDKEKLKEIEIEGAKALAEIDAKERELETEHIEKIDSMHKSSNQKRFELENQLSEHKKKLHQIEIKQISAGLQASIRGLQTFATSGLQLLENTGNENKDLIGVLFKMNQAAAIADIAFSTARAIAAAPANFGPLAPLAIPAIAAGGAAQAAVVLSQAPPMHMGGIIQPDERQAKVLTGESILDRNTTRRLGEDGVRRLQNGQGTEPQIIVMNPYKHLDRYNKSAIQSQKSALKRFKAARGAGGY